MRKIELVLGFRCNCRCVFCVVDPAVAGQAMSTAEAVRHLQESRRGGATAVDFGGGEPTLRRDLPELARTAKRLGYRRIGIKSNGLRLCYPDYVEKLMRAGVREFSVPVWGHAPAVHDALAQTQGAFEMLEMGVKHIVDFGGGIEADVLLTTKSIPHLQELVGHFASIGVRRFQLWLFCLFGSNHTGAELLPTMTAAGRAIVETAAALKGRRLRLSTTHIPACFLRPREDLYSNIADQRLTIVTPGGSFPAEASPFEAGHQAAACAGCARVESCAGLRPEYLERFDSGEIAPL